MTFFRKLKIGTSGELQLHKAQVSKRVAIIIPTLGLRLDYLEQTIKSIRNSEDVFLVIISPQQLNLNPQLATLVNEFQLEEGKGLAAAINQAAFGLPAGVEYFNWLGDDDLLTPNSISISAKALDNNPTASGVFGKCEYINSEGNRIGVNSSGLWATKLIMFGPDLIPQPGALLRLSTFKLIGGLRTQYKLAFDVDMFIRLQKAHPLIYVSHILGKFRWHNDSLSVKSRLVSAKESSVIRRKNLPKSIRRLSLLWEIPVIILTYAAGWFVQIKNWRLN